MAEVEFTEESPDEREPNSFLQIAHRVLLAGIGAVALAQSEIEEFVDRLVERGEIAEKDGRKILSDVLERRRSRGEDTEEIAESHNGASAATPGEVDRRIEGILHRLNVPTKADIDSLGEKIAALTAKVDQLKKAQEA